MQQQNSLRERILTYCKQKESVSLIPPLDLTGSDLSGYDLRGCDLTGVILNEVNMTTANLEGTRLQNAMLNNASFAGVRVGMLLGTGLSPRFLLHHRSEADRGKYRSLHFSPLESSHAPLLLTARECTQVCHCLQEVFWEDLTSSEVLTTLYPDERWYEWMVGCRSRLILTWALEHRVYLNRMASNIPFYGRILPLTLVDEVKDTDLVAGVKTSPERVFHEIGVRQLLKESDLQGTNVPYPLSPFGDADKIVQIKSRQGLQMEGAVMHHCVASYDDACLGGQCFMYHIGQPAPEGSTLEMFPNGDIGQHRAIRNRAPDMLDRNIVGAWLKSLGIERDTSTTMERICTRLHEAGVVTVSFQIYWYNDEDTVADISAVDRNNNFVPLRTVSDEDLWDSVREAGRGIHGQWELNVEEKRLDLVGEECPPDDDDDAYCDEPDFEDGEEEE